MIWVRKGFAFLLSLLLLVTLLGTALSTSTNVTLSKPKKVEAFLAQSRLYDHFIAYTTDQAKKSQGSNPSDQAGSVSLNDDAVLKAAKQAFPPSLIQQSVNSFIDANYDWLEGKTATPQFKIDLTHAKLTFAQKVGKRVTTFSASLPQCVSAQDVQQQVGVDPLEATCRPPGAEPATLGAAVTKNLSASGDFLSDPVITANSVNPKGNQQSEPYYQKLSQLPKVYRLGTKLPYVFGVLSLLFALGVIFIALTRRRGFRQVGIVLALAGVVLIGSKFVADFTLRRIEHLVFNTANVGQLQQSLTNFLDRVETSLLRTNLWFGIGFLALALIIFIALLTTRNKGPRKPKVPGAPGDADAESENRRMPLIKARKRLMRPFGESIMPLGARPGGQPEKPAEAPEAASEPPKSPDKSAEAQASQSPADGGQAAPKPKKRRKPRLIQ